MNGEFNFIVDQQRGVNGWPTRGGKRLGATKLVPNFFGEVRRERRQQFHEADQLIARQAAVGRAGQRCASRGGVDHFNQRGDSGVECQSLNVLANFFTGAVQKFFKRGVALCGQQQFAGALIHRKTPCALQKSKTAGNVAGVPWLGRLKRTHGHFIQAECVGAKVGDHIVGIHHVLQALAHLGDHLLHGLPGGFFREHAVADFLDGVRGRK